MYRMKHQYPSRKLPSINSQQSIHAFDKSRSKSIGRQRQVNQNLSPYIAEIDRRRKVYSVLRDKSQRSKSPNNSRNDISAKKFRIQERSYYSNSRNNSSLLNRRNQSQNHTINHTFTNTNTTTNLTHETQPAVERRRGFSRRRILPEQLTIQRPSITIIDQEIKELYDKLKTKHTEKSDKQQKGFRRGKYAQQDHDKTPAQSDLRKIAYTVNNIDKNKEIDLEELKGCNKTVLSNPKTNNNQQKKNFRRNKYEVQSQIIPNQDLKHQNQAKYSSVDIQKKQSNTSLIRQLDLQTQKQAEQQDRVINQKIKKMLDKSIQKSTEQYFQEHSGQRHIKSRNQIQIYVSTVKNPSINRCSQASTLNMSDKKDGLYVSTVKESLNPELIGYDFNLEQQGAQNKQTQKDNSQCFLLPQQEEDSASAHQICQLSQFDKDRKEAERKFINKDIARISWQQEMDCTVKAELEE